MERRTFIKTLLGLFAGVHTLPSVAGKEGAQARRVLIQHSPLAGFQYYAGPLLQGKLSHGQPLTLQREPHNQYDKRAVAVYWQGQKLGYVPRRENRVVSKMMDRGEWLEAVIAGLGGGDNPWQAVTFDIEVVV